MPLWKVRQYCSQGIIPHAFLSLLGTVSEPFAIHSKKAILLTLISLPLITKPAIVLADEPTGNLDSKTSAEVLGLIKRTSAEFRQTVVMITHNDDIARLADRIVRIEDGRIVE